MKNRLYKILSVLLTLCLMLSVCNIVLYAESTAKTVTYYVDSTNGSTDNDGLSETTAVPTVADAVAKAEGFVAGDNIIVNVMGETANMGTFASEYTATLTVQSADALTKTTVKGSFARYILGPTVFKNVTLDATSTESNQQRIYVAGYDVVFESDVSFGDLTTFAANSYANTTTGDRYTIPAQTVTFNNAVTSSLGIYLPNVGHCNGTKYTEDFNLIVNNDTATPSVYIDPDGNVTYSKNYNYFIKNAASFTHAAATNVITKGAFQVVVNSNTTVAEATKTNLDTIGSTATGGYYYVTASDDIIDSLSLTETAGKYAVAGDVNLVAVNTETLEEVKSEDGFITLTEAGEWGISEYFPPVTRNYFVDSTNGSDENDGLTYETPVTTVAAAVAKATDLDGDDTIVVNLIGETANVGTFEADYTPKLIVQSYSADIKTTLTGSEYRTVSGPTEFKNVTLTNDKSTMYFRGKNVVLNSDVTLSQSNIASHTYNSLESGITGSTDAQTVILRNTFSGVIRMGNSGHFNSFKFKDDATLEIDNAASAVTLEHGCYYPNNGVTTITFADDFNYFIRNAKSIGVEPMRSNGTYKIGGGFQVLMNSGITLSDTSKTNLDAIGALATGGYFYLTVDGTDYIELTKTAGVYEIAEGYTAAAVNVDTLEEITSDESGELVLPAGEWEVSVTKIPVTRDYYVKADGTGDGLSYESPVATVGEAVGLASDLIKGDTIRVNVIGETVTMGTMPTHAATLYIQSADSDVKTKVSYNTDSSLGGPVVFKNITVAQTNTDYRMVLYGQSVTIESDVSLGSIGTLTFNTYNSNSNRAGQTVTVKNNSSLSIIAANDGHFNSTTYSDDVNLIIDNSSSTHTISHSTTYGGPVYYKKNLNYIVKNASTISFGAIGGPSANTETGNVYSITGGMQVLVNSNTTVNDVDNVKAVGAKATGGFWYLTVTPTAFEAMEVSATAGKYKVADGYQAVATNDAGTTVTSEDGVLTLDAGEWTVTVREEQTTLRSEYINYRRDLSNTYAKLVNNKEINKEINVVYFGGSVTNGYGVDNSADCWRARIGSWLQNTFPEATINNYNRACGESGTFLGSYRLARDVLSCEPDLLFLEYSINDKYDYATYERASMQYETIVRQVKDKYPTCDIVTVLVTDSGVAEAARKENGSALHIQAQAHEDVAAHYDIPTLHVGRYLADSLPEDWTYDEDWKGVVAIDTVHLTEYGNDLYYQVIKEYLNNCLVYGEYDAENPVEPDGLPEMINDELLDGNITFIQPSAELITRSEELGGSGFSYNSGNYTISGYTGIFTVSNTATDPMIAIEFNGTELIALMHNYPSGSQFQMKVDDGEWQTVDYYHMNPQTLVTGLEAGDHTVYFKPAFTDTKTWQWIGGLYSRDATKATTKATAGPITKAYYVKNGGTGDGRTPENPAATVDAVIPYINADGLDGDDTANIYIMQRDDWNTIPEGTIGKIDGVQVTQPHNITAWNTSGGKLTTAHTAKIVLKSYDSSNKSYLAFSEKLGLNANIGCNGPTVFDDVVLVYTRNTHDTRITTYYNDVTFTNKLTYGYVNCSEYDETPETWDGKVYTLDAAVAEYTPDASTRDNTVVLSAPISTFYMTADYYNESTHEHNFNIEVDNGGSDITFKWGSSHANGCISTFNGNLNFNIKNAGTVTNAVGRSSEKPSTVIINGALQYIYSSSVTLANKPGDLLNQVDETTQKGVVVNGDSWFIKNASGFDGLLSFTSTPGTYTVDERCEVTAKNDDTGATATVNENGELVLTAGNWTVEGKKIPVTKDYYVKNGGTGDGRTVETPAATVYDVIAAVNEDLIAGDIANINIMQRDDYNSVTGMSGNNQTGTVHNFTSWTAIGKGTVPAYAAKLVVKPYDETVTTYLAYCDQYWAQSSLAVRGETEFRNICLVDTRGNYDNLSFGAYNVKLCDDVTFGVLKANSTVEIYRSRSVSLTSTASGDQTVEIYNPTEAQLYVNANSYSVGTRQGNVTVIIDNNIDTNRPSIRWGAVHSSSSFTHNGNINIDIRNAYSVWHGLVSSSYGVGKTKINGAVQIITRSDVVSNGSLSDMSENLTVSGGIWDITLVSDTECGLTFTDTAGTFAVKDGYTATAISQSGEKTGSADGLLTIGAGKYTVYVADEFTNTGDEITVNKECEIDLSTVAHAKKDGKLFVGWKNAKTDEYAAATATYTAGDVLKAVYIDYAEGTDFVYEEAMTTEDTGLRFIFSRNKTFYNNLPEVIDTGAIVLPTDQGGYYDMFLDEAVVSEWQWDEATGYNFTPKTTGKTPTTVTHLNVLEENEETLKYTVCITDLTEEKYATYYNAKGYIKYKDHNGVESILYTEQAQSCLYKSSAEAAQKREVDTKVITVAEKAFADNKSAYKTDRVLKYGTGTEGDVYNIYNYNGLNIRDLVIDTGIDGFEETDVFFVSDPHFNYISERDTTEGLATTLSSYRGREWARSGWSIGPTVKAMNMANSYDRVVMGGDAVDYVSYGGLALTNRVFTQRSVNGNLTMLMGNHEGDELSQPDMAMSNILTLEQRFAFCQDGWSNDVYYSSDIISNSAGEEQVMIIGLDNSRVQYWESQIEPLTNDLAYARENGLVVLIFQHIAMLTMNPNETAYKYGNSNDTSYFGTEAAGTVTRTRNMTTYTNYLGNANSDETTMTVYNLIRSNADIIKGVFHGHDHCNMYTEIIGTDANSTKIPQHGVAGIHYSAAMAITLK